MSRRAEHEQIKANPNDNHHSDLVVCMCIAEEVDFQRRRRDVNIAVEIYTTFRLLIHTVAW